MRLAFISDNDLLAIERDARFAHEQGFAGLEFNYWKQFADLTPDTIGQMRLILDTHRIRASMLGLWGWNYLSPDPSERSDALKQLDRGIEFAQQLGADTLVTGTGDLPGEAIGRKTAEFSRVMLPYVDRMKELRITPAFYGLHPASFLDSIAACERLWEVAPQVTLKLDPANWAAEGQDYLDILHRFGNKVGYLHIKEALHHHGRRIAEPAAGLGDIAWPKVFALLHEHNYEGWLSLEPHGPQWTKPPLREKGLILGKRYINQFLL